MNLYNKFKKAAKQGEGKMDKDKKYEKVAKELLEHVGGKENVISVAHCDTRLRIVLKDDKKINTVFNVHSVIHT